MTASDLTTRGAGLVAVAVLVLVVACGRGHDAGGAASAAPTTLTGSITVDGSSTVMPLSQAIAEGFRRAHPGVKVAVAESGTGGGFQKLCAGSADLIGASRPINAAEIKACAANHVTFVELPMAFDSLSVVVNPRNTFAECLTVAELKRMWEPSAEKRVMRWKQVRSSFPDRPLALAGPGTASGTFDYFTLAVVGTQSLSRTDYLRSEDDEVVAKAVAEDVNALGYFGYDYYLEHKDTLKLVAVDSGGGCVLPSPETVTNGSYQPLSRPVFVYASSAALDRPAVKALARAYVDPANAARVGEIGFVPLPIASLLIIARRLETGETGSRFGGRGSMLGLTLDTFSDDERIKNALVR